MGLGSIIVVLVVLPLLWLIAIVIGVRKLHRRWQTIDGRSRRCAITLAMAGVILSPYLAYRIVDLRFALARVPDPLHALWIDYRLEENWGFGPGGNETGFVVYRLTPGSADWARRQGDGLGRLLAHEEIRWRPTPVAEGSNPGAWHPSEGSYGKARRPLDVRAYLDRYGFGIPVAVDREKEFNRAITRPGSFYAYGRGGSLTVVDPANGKVYFIYAG